MAIKPGYKQFTFDGESSGNYGVYITGSAVYNSPKRDVELIEIPGRNGSFVLDNGRFENIEVTYPAGIYAESQEDFAQAISDLRNMLSSRKGYCRLTDEYNPEEYRMAVYKSGLDVDPVAFQRAGEFNITFDCKPQRWLVSGEAAITIGEWGETETASGDIVEVENPNGILAVKSLEVDLEPIQDLNGYDAPWVGGAGKNKLKFPYASQSGTLNQITYTHNSDGSVTLSGTATAQTNINFNSSSSSSRYAIGSGTQKVISSAQASYNPQITGINFQTDIYKDGTYVGTVQKGSTSLAVSSATEISIGLSRLSIASGTVIPSGTVFYPQIEFGTEQTSWTPYENICPISGHTDVAVSRTGVNVWDEEWELGRLDFNKDSPTWGQNIDTGNQIRSTNYVSVKPSTSYYCKSGTASTIYAIFYDAEKHPVMAIANDGYMQIANRAFTAPSDAHYIRFYCTNTTTYNNDISINYPSTDTEYHAYQGDTYTTALGTTVYGGTLDVTTGVLTVTHAIEDLGNLNWVYSTGQNNYFYSNSIADFKFIDNDTVNYICSAYAGCSVNERYKNGYVFINSGKQAVIVDNNYTSAAAFKTAVTGQKIVYELATPTTVQLTAQQIDLLTGDNNIWSDSGDITLEYGQNPSVLFNPTLFESGPLLEATGSGTIEFNGYTIEFAGIPYGEIVICPTSYGFHQLSQTVTVTLDTSLLNSGDAIYPEVKDCYVIARLENSASASFLYRGIGTTSNVLEAKALPTISQSKKQFHMYLYPDFGDGFVYGTSKTIVSSAVYNYRLSGTDYSETVGVTITYGGANTYTVKVTSTGTLPANVSRKSYALSVPTMYGDSTQPIQGVPIYIDCDLGEAYLINGTEYVSLNHRIDLGSDLPKLASGSNTITFDNTITELKVTPRYWKV